MPGQTSEPASLGLAATEMPAASSAPPPPSPTLKVSEIVADRYEVRELLGEGGMGAVFRVFDRELEEEVALKVLHPSLASGAALDRFRREVKLARRVTHPNVARTYDLGGTTLRFITMELVIGEPVSTLLRDGRRPPLPEALRIAEGISRGLAAAHAAGVVHRDLKPENVMRCAGANGRIVITDFGIARVLAPDPMDARKTGGQVIGTPAYMAPEQLSGAPIDGRTDVYAFGTMLFELVTGRLPFERDTALAAIAARLIEDSPNPRTIDPLIVEPVATLVLAMLSRSRERRPDAERILEAIERLRGTNHDRHFAPRRLPRTGESKALTSSPASSQATDVTVAVVAADAAAEELARTLADALTSSKLRGLEVIPPALLADAGGARGAGAAWLMEVSLRAASGKRRARVRILDLAENKQIWASPAIDGGDDEIFEFEDRVAHAVADAVRQRLDVGARGPEDPDARAIYEGARALVRRRALPCLREAAAVLEQGVVRFPLDPWLTGLLGRVLVNIYSATGAAEQELAVRGEEMALRALAIDPTLGETYLTIGILRTEQCETRGAVCAVEECLARTPKRAEAHVLLGILLAESGRVDEARQSFDTALHLDPIVRQGWVERARLRALTGDREGAEEDLRQLSAIGGAALTAVLLVRLVIWWADRAGALDLAESLDRAKTGAAWEVAAPALRAFGRGEDLPADTNELLERLVPDGRVGPRSRCRVIENGTEIFAAVGRHEEAFRWLEEAATLPFINVLWIDRCPCLDGLRADPRFAKIRDIVAARAADIWR